MADMVIPDWLTEEFLKCCLETDQESFPEVTVTKFTAEPAVPPGNNYGSNMLRVTVHYTTSSSSTPSLEQTTKLIVKAPFVAEYAKLFEDMWFKEPKYYNEFIQETYKICKHDIVPKSYPSPIPNCVVMEDLKSSGYEMVDRRNLLDLEHSRLFIKASAKLQALSIAVYKTNSELIESIGVDSPNTIENWNQMNKTLMKKELMCVATLFEDDPKQKDKVDLIKHLIDDDRLFKFCSELEELDWPLKSLAQLDPWCTNMMFKYDRDRKATGVKLLDFQTTKLTSPLFEFFIFVFSSVHPDVRQLELDTLYKLYCDSMNENLSEFGCSERLTFEYLKSAAVTFSPLVLYIAVDSLSFCLSDEAANINDLLYGEFSPDHVRDSGLFQIYKTPLITQSLTQVLKQLEEFGVFKYFKDKFEESDTT